MTLTLLATLVYQLRSQTRKLSINGSNHTSCQHKATVITGDDVIFRGRITIDFFNGGIVQCYMHRVFWKYDISILVLSFSCRDKFLKLCHLLSKYSTYKMLHIKYIGPNNQFMFTFAGDLTFIDALICFQRPKDNLVSLLYKCYVPVSLLKKHFRDKIPERDTVSNSLALHSYAIDLEVK